MEVLQRNRILYGLAPAASMYPPAAAVHRMFVTPSDVYSCYTYEANTPSRTPTPERQQSSSRASSSSSHAKHAAAPMDISSSQTTTLHSVLRGEIPAAYSHLASSASSSSSSPSSSTNSPSTSSLSSSNYTSILSSALLAQSSSSQSSSKSSSHSSLSSNNSSLFLSHNYNAMEMDSHSSSSSSPSSSSLSKTLLRPAVPSPCPSHHSSSSLSYSPRPLSHESHASQDSLSYMQTEPMDLSCKKSSSSSRKRTAVSAFLDVATGKASSELLSSSLPAKFGSSSSSSSSDFSPFPSSSSPSVTSMHSFPPSPADGSGGEEFSLLRNLLSVGKHNLSPPSGSSGLSNSSPNLTSSSSDRTCDSPASDSFSLRTPVSGNTRVTLAKKNMLPVSARVSDWLVKIVQFAKSIPEFSTLSHNDKVTLILNSWSRLMLLFMAESNFQFAVTPVPSSMDSALSSDNAPSHDEPTMKSVEGVQTFIKKCQQMAVDSKEYEFLRMLVLFNAGYVGLSCPENIDQLNSVVQQLLQQHVRVTRPNDVMHYSRLLMSLPSLYGINSTMLEKFFCKHISRNTDMDVLLKELLQNVV